MNIYIIKVSNSATVGLIKTGKTFIHDGINILEDKIKLGELVFIYLGGDKKKISWEQGIKAVGVIKRTPFEKGYDEKKNNFKI